MSAADEHFEDPGDIPAVVEETTILDDVLQERAPLPEPELLRMFLEVLSDLERAHGDGMLHGDISPARIVLNGAGWKLTDYGLDNGAVRYMSPERCQGKPMDARSDIYSLGVVLFQAATGRVPFDAEMKFQIMDAHAGTPPPSPRAINPAVSEELDQIILRALAKDPSARFQTATEFRLAIEAMVPASDRPSEPVANQTAEWVAEAPSAGISGEQQPFVTAETAVESVQTTPEVEPSHEPRRFKLAPVLVPLAAVVVVVVGLLLLTGVIGGRRVPLVTGMSSDKAGQMLSGKGFRAETDTVDDTLPAGTVVAQVPAAGEKGPRSRKVDLRVSTGTVKMPSLAGLALPDARARLARLALTSAKVDSQYSDEYPANMVVSGKLEAGTKVAPHTSVGLTVSAGRATCPQCGTRREARAKFCTKCGYKF